MSRAILVLALVWCVVLLTWPSPAADRTAFSLDKRIPWTTSKVKGSPEPPSPYRTEVAFPKLPTFHQPLDMAFAPGSNRFFVAERFGKVFSFVNDRAADKADLVLDLNKTIYGFAFHPQYAKNGYLFITYVLDPNKTEPKGTRVSRFEVTRTDPPRCDLKSEKLIFEWPSGGHNGGAMQFGPDGCLYIATGDGSGVGDELQTGQDLGDVLGAMLRIDVDKPDPGKSYGIPKDNPFVATPGARPELWAYGLRQPWRFSFDPKTGDLWAGEVGQDLWEMVLKIERGGNYGWSVTEGRHPFRPERKRGPTPILPPVAEHPHIEFRSITGGYVYHGKRLPELTGAYVYGDFDTGRVWALRHDGQRVTWQKELVDTAQRIICFAADPAGEVVHVDFIGGGIHRLVTNPAPTTADTFPRKLSETGLFSSTKDLVPALGLIPYSVNSQLWSDGGSKERFLALPGDGQIEIDGILYPSGPGAPKGWRFPDGTVLVKTFFLEAEQGKPETRRRLETRLLHFEKLSGGEEIGDQYWRGYTYLWNDAQTDAELLDAKGLDREYAVRDAKAPGGVRRQTWHFPSRAECTLCHTMPAKFVLGVNTLQMNKEHDYGSGVRLNQLKALEKLGVFTNQPSAPPEKLPRLVDHEDPKQDLDRRARSYLHSNCAHCHMQWGGGNADFQLLATLSLPETKIVNVRPGQGAFDLKDPRVLAPGEPERSMLYHRMTRTGLGRMPHVASSVVDETGVQLIREWIAGMPKEPQ